MSSILNLSDLYAALLGATPPSSDGVYGLPVLGYPMHRLATDRSKAPMVLIRIPPGNVHARPTAIRLENVSIQHDVECRLLNLAGVAERGNYSIVACTGKDRSLHEYFLRIMSSVLEVLGPEPSRITVDTSVRKLIDLFRAITVPARKSVQGLWAELFLIYRSLEPNVVASSWRLQSGDKFDFSLGGQRVEVKSSAGRSRSHTFSLEQLVPAAAVEVIIASVIVERSSGGTTLSQLFSEVRIRVGADLQLLDHLESVFVTTLGSSWRNALDDAFDMELAAESLAFFSADSVPRVTTPLPSEVTQLHFVSNISNIAPLSNSYLSSAGGLFLAVTELT